MEKLSEQQQNEYNKQVKDLSAQRIEVGKVIEFWQSPERFQVGGNDFLPENLKDSHKKNHVCFYKDQYGIIQSAILVQKHFATIVKMEPADYYGIYVEITAEDAEFTFRKKAASNGEWSRMRKDGQGYSLEFMLAEDAYNGRVLFLDKEGLRPEPQKPTVVCNVHDWAHHESESCPICTGHDHHISRELLRLCNTGHVIWKNDDVYTINKG